jgi:ADP-ribose pyrophosphatase YjhB (NUDIX family)
MQPRIRTIALCLFSHEGKILVSEELDTVKGSVYARPVGGGIEFGERSIEAIRREIQEELSQEIESIELVGVLENHFTLEGASGHEIVFVYDARFFDQSCYDKPYLDGVEHDVNAQFKALWRSPAELRAANIRLVPESLESLLVEKGLASEGK